MVEDHRMARIAGAKVELHQAVIVTHGTGDGDIVTGVWHHTGAAADKHRDAAGRVLDKEFRTGGGRHIRLRDYGAGHREVGGCVGREEKDRIDHAAQSVNGGRYGRYRSEEHTSELQ